MSEITSVRTPAREETVPFFPVADETRIAFKQGGGTGKGGLVPTEVLAPPKTGPVEGYNNIVQFRGAKIPVAPPPGVTAAPGQTFFQQGAFVFAAPTGDDTIAGRKYLGFAPGFSALSLLRASMQAQGFPSGSKVIWGEGLPREHQITADQARRLLATEGSAEDSRGGRALQRAEKALSGKLLGIMNELAQRQKPATPALATRTPAVAPKPAPVPANEARQTPPAEASSLPPRVRPSTSPLPPPPTFEQPSPRPTAPPRDIVAEEAKKQAVLDTRFAEAAVKQAPSWSARADTLAGLGRDLSNRATGPQANAANEAFARSASLVDRGGRLASAVAAADAGKRPDVFVSGRNLPLAEARAELGRLTQDADRSLAALKPEIDRLPKASTATSANPFDAPQRPGPGVTLGSPLDKLSPGVRDIVEHELEQIEKDRKLGIGNPVETAIERLKRDGQYAAAIALGQLFPDLVQASSITPRPSSPTALRSDATADGRRATLPADAAAVLPTPNSANPVRASAPNGESLAGPMPPPGATPPSGTPPMGPTVPPEIDRLVPGEAQRMLGRTLAPAGTQPSNGPPAVPSATNPLRPASLDPDAISAPKGQTLSNAMRPAGAIRATQTPTVGPVVPPDIDALVPPGSLTRIEDLPPEQQEMVAQIAADTGRIVRVRDQLLQWKNDTWAPVADFKGDVTRGLGDLWNAVPNPVRKTIGVSGAILGAVVNPVGTAIDLAGKGVDLAMKTPAGQKAMQPLLDAASKVGEAQDYLRKHPVGKHLMGVWDNSIGHPDFGQSVERFTKGAGAVGSVVANGALAAVASQLASGDIQFKSFVTASPVDLTAEEAQIFREIGVVPKGTRIHYAQVKYNPDPTGNPGGKQTGVTATLWFASKDSIFLPPGLPGQLGTAQPTVALTQGADGKTSAWLFSSAILGGRTDWAGMTVHATVPKSDKPGDVMDVKLHRSGFVTIPSSAANVPLVRVGPQSADMFDLSRTSPKIDPGLIGSAAAIRIGLTDEYIVDGVSLLKTRSRVPVKPTGRATFVQVDENNKLSLQPRVDFDANARPVVSQMTLIGPDGGYVTEETLRKEAEERRRRGSPP
jgi:hypothetical protein